MTIDNIDIKDCDGHIICKATAISNNWKYCNNIVYYCDEARWSCDYYMLSDNIKKMCRREWNRIAKANGISCKVLNIII